MWQALLEIMTAAAEDAGAAAGGVGALVADVQRQVTQLEAAQEAAAATGHDEASEPERDDDLDMPADAEGVERIANYFAERARRKLVRRQIKACSP